MKELIVKNQTRQYLDDGIKKMLDKIIIEQAKTIAKVVEEDKLRPMIAEALYRLGFSWHKQGGMEIDNSIMAKYIIQILNDIVFVLKSEENKEVSKKYKHIRYGKNSHKTKTGGHEAK